MKKLNWTRQRLQDVLKTSNGGGGGATKSLLELPLLVLVGNSTIVGVRVIWEGVGGVRGMEGWRDESIIGGSGSSSICFIWVMRTSSSSSTSITSESNSGARGSRPSKVGLSSSSIIK